MSEEAAAAPPARPRAGEDGAAGAAAAAEALRAGRAWEFKRDLAAGALMGGAVHTVVAPIERVKLLLQTQDGNAALLGRSRRFRGFFDCVARTVREEGVLSLWRGNGTAVIRYYPSVALNFSLKDLYRSILKDAGTSADNKFTSIALTNFIAGAAAGCTTLKHKGTSGRTEIDNPNLVQQKRTKAEDDDELVNTDASQKAKNDMATLDFLAELEAKFSLDIYRQSFAHSNNLPIPPPSWHRVPTPPIPSSPPPIVEIGNCEEAKNAVKAWRQGRCMHLQVSEELSLSDAENISEIVKDAHAERVVLNPSILEAKASQAKYLRQMIRHTVGELQRYNQMLTLPWMPTQTLSGSSLL